MTPRQQQVYDFISRHLVESGYSPTYREIATGLGVKSVGPIARHIEKLCKDGHLRRFGRGCHGLEVVASRMEFYLVGPYECAGLGHPWPPLILIEEGLA